MKEPPSQLEAEKAIRDQFNRIPFAHLETLRASNGEGTSAWIDYLADLKIDGKSITLAIEYKNQGHPQRVREAAGQLNHYLAQARHSGKITYGILVAPFISAASAKICDEASIGYIDFAGNAHLRVGHVLIDRRIAEKNPFRRKEFYSLFSARAARALRFLLAGPLRPWKVQDLAIQAKVSLGWISQIRQQLLAEEWAVADEAGLLVTRPTAILDAWAKQDDWPTRTSVRQYSLLLNEPRNIAERLRDLIGPSRYAYTQWFAGWLRHPYTIPPIVTAYVEEFPDEDKLRKEVLARRVEDGGRLWLVKPHDEGVFKPAQAIDGFPLVPDVQIYLDLLQAGLRGKEQADELRQASDFSGGWS